MKEKTHKLIDTNEIINCLNLVFTIVDILLKYNENFN